MNIYEADLWLDSFVFVFLQLFTVRPVGEVSSINDLSSLSRVRGDPLGAVLYDSRRVHPGLTARIELAGVQ